MCVRVYCATYWLEPPPSVLFRYGLPAIFYSCSASTGALVVVMLLLFPGGCLYRARYAPPRVSEDSPDDASDASSRNRRHFDTIEGGRNTVEDSV